MSASKNDTCETNAETSQQTPIDKPGDGDFTASSERKALNTSSTSAIRFTSEDQTTRRPSRSASQREQPDAHETTPIRHRDGDEQRSYNTQHNPSPKQGQQVEQQVDAGKTTTWWKSLRTKITSVELENKGSTARDHLALERTFLAWLRTSLAFASIGIAITQLFRLNTTIASNAGSSNVVGTLLDQLLTPATPDGTSGGGFTAYQLNDNSARTLRSVGKPLGATFLGMAILVLLVGFHRYFEAQYWVTKGKFPASRGSIALVGLGALALILTSFVVILVIAPTNFEKK